MIAATDKSWESATNLYIARRLETIADGRRISVLDMGCGNGRIIEDLAEYDHDLYGYDLRRTDVDHDARRRVHLLPVFGSAYDDHIKVTDSERDIPFADDSFDVVYANQVFEHIRFLDRMLAECARVLKPGGTLLMALPLATSLIEEHLAIPFAHWIPPGPTRIRYLQAMSAAHLIHRWPGDDERSPYEMALTREEFLRDKTFYRFINEIESVGGYWFESSEVETRDFLQAKIDLMRASPRGSRARLGSWLQKLDQTGLVSAGVTYFANAAICLRNPRQPDERSA